ncbi:hypothetical protein [Geodermatophilus obscurus]|uniref:hypothetical protein n=1 Tax=Geodermatophilus obscurus TaxID=1861 RepID=UPI003C7E3009
MILAEIGADMGRFPTPPHPTSWTRFAPGSASRPAQRRATPAPATARQEAGHRGGRPLHPVRRRRRRCARPSTMGERPRVLLQCLCDQRCAVDTAGELGAATLLQFPEPQLEKGWRR